MSSDSLDYSIEFVRADARRGGLSYYVYSEKLFLSLMTFTSEGLPVVDYPRLGTQWNPAYVAWWALMGATAYTLGKDRTGLEQFRRGARWLVDNARDGENGSALWLYSFPWREGGAFLTPPWISSISQGLGISTLLLAYRENGESRYLDVAIRAAIPFSAAIGNGGLRSSFGDSFIYEEYPANPPSRILDGSVFGLMGLYDLSRQTGTKEHEELFQAGIDGIRQNITYWNYRNKWSWYGAHRYLCSPMYNKLNSVLMEVLHAISGDHIFKQYAEHWNPTNLSFIDLLEIKMVYLITLNMLRARLLLQK